MAFEVQLLDQAGLKKRGTSALSVKVANTLERVALLNMRGAIYAEALGHHGVDLHDKSSIHVVAVDGGQLVAAARLLGPLPLGLEIGQFIDTQHSLPEPRRVMQVGGFWVLPSRRRLTTGNVAALVALLEKCLEISRRFGSCGLIMRTIPKLKPWYQLLGFEPQPELGYADPLWGSVITMYLRVSERLEEDGPILRLRPQRLSKLKPTARPTEER